MPSFFLPATAKDCLDAARMFLNDNAMPIQLWTDPVLMPMMKQAHLELQAILKQRASPSMRGYATITLVPFEIELIPPPSDLVLPIRIYEKPRGAPASAFQIMTETDMLPFQIVQNQLIYWMWDQDTIMFVGSNLSVDIFVDYWRRIPVPTANTDLVEIIDGEQYLGPRIAALAMASVGEEATSAIANQLANTQLERVLAANKSRGPAGATPSIVP